MLKKQNLYQCYIYVELCCHVSCLESARKFAASSVESFVVVMILDARTPVLACSLVGVPEVRYDSGFLIAK